MTLETGCHSSTSGPWPRPTLRSWGLWLALCTLPLGRPSQAQVKVTEGTSHVSSGQAPGAARAKGVRGRREGRAPATYPGDRKPQHKARGQLLPTSRRFGGDALPRVPGRPLLSNWSVQDTGLGLAETPAAPTHPCSPELPAGQRRLCGPPWHVSAPLPRAIPSLRPGDPRSRPADPRSTFLGGLPEAGLFPSLLAGGQASTGSVPLLGTFPAFRDSGNLFLVDIL